MNHRNWLKLTILFFAVAIRSQAQFALPSFVFSNDVARFPTVSLNAVTFGGTNFVAVGTNATVWTTHLTTTTGTSGWLNLGTNWSKKVPGSGTVGFEAAAYGNGIFITGGSGNQVFKSTDDGLNWLGLGNAFPDTLDIKGLAYSFPVPPKQGNYVAVSQGLDITYSPSLSSWTEATINSQVIFEGYRAVSPYGFGNDLIACGVGGVIRTSTDNGVTWNVSGANSYDGSQATLLGAAGDGNNHLVCVGASGTIKYSGNNGTSWSTFQVGGNDLNAVTWTGNGFMAVGNSGTILVSSNGSSSSWKTSHSPISANFTGVAFGNSGPFQNVAMLVGAGGQVVIGGIPPTASVVSNTVGSICNGSSVDVTVNLGGSQGPWNVTLTDGTNNYVTNSSSSTVTFTVFPANTNQNASAAYNYVLKSVIDEITGFSAPAGNLSGNFAVTNNPRPTAVASGTTAICNGGSTPVQVVLTGVGPWTVTLSSNGVTLPPVVVGPSGPGPYTNIFTVSPTNTSLNAASISTYSVTNLTDANCTAGASDLSGKAAITVNPRPTAQVSGTTAICNGGSTFVPVTFTGIGPWTVNLSSNGVTLPSMVVGSSGPGPYTTNFTVSPTNTSLNAASISTYAVTNLTDANCTAENIDLTGNAAITVNPRPKAQVTGTTAICNGGSTPVPVNLTGIGPWTVTLSSNGVALPPVVVGVSGPGPYTTNFTVSPTNTSLNAASISTYAVTALTDATACSANPGDLSGSAVITVNPRPTAAVSGTTAICNGGSTPVQVSFTGIGPWTVALSSNGVTLPPLAVGPSGPGPFTTNFTVSPTNMSLNAASTSTYAVTNLTDAHCTAETMDLTGAAAITVNPRPTAAVSGTTAICNGGSTFVPVNLTGIGPWLLTLSSNGVALAPVIVGPSAPGPYTTNFTVSPTNTSLNAASTSTYVVSVLADSHCTAEAADLSGNAAITVNPRPTAVLSGTTAICNGGSTVVPVSLTGLGPWTVTLSSNGVVLPPVMVGSGGPGPYVTNFTVSPTNTSLNAASTSTYLVTNLTDAHCTAGPGDLTGTAAVTVDPRPTATVSLSGVTPICNGSSTTVAVGLTGLGPWNVVLSDGFDSYTSNGVVSTNITFTVTPTNGFANATSNFTYTVISLTDAHCTAEPIDFTDNALVTVDPRPTATVSLSGVTPICNGSSTTVSVALTGLGPWNVVLSDGFDSYTSNGAVSTNITFTVTPTNGFANATSNFTYTVTSLTSQTGADCPAEPGDLKGSAVVTVDPRPTATVSLSGVTPICNGSSTTVAVGLTGLGPWNVVLSDGFDSYTSNGVSATNITFTVTPTNSFANATSNFTYAVISLTDAHCTAEPVDLKSNALVTVDPRPTAMVSLSGVTPICNGSSTTVAVGLTGLGPWNVVLSDGFDSYTSNGAVSTNITFTVTPTNGFANVTSNFTYTVISLTDAHCTAEPVDLKSNALVTVDPRPTATVSLSGITPICNGSSTTVAVALTGLGPWNVVLSDGFDSYTSNGVVSTNFTFAVTPTNGFANATSNFTYAVISLTDAHCTAEPVDLKSNAVVTVDPRPTAVLSGTQAICNGGAATLPVTLNGFGPWILTLSSNGTALPPVTLGANAAGPLLTNIIVSPTNASSSVTSTTAYSVTNLMDTNCAADPADLSGSAVVTVNPLPIPTSLGDQTNCVGVTNPPLVVSVLTNAAFPAGSITVDWYDSGTNGNLVASGTNAFSPTNNTANTYKFWAQASATNANCGCVCVNTNRTGVTLVLQDCTSTNSGWPKIQLVGTNVVVTWLGNVDLQHTNDLTSFTNGWTNVATGTVAITNSYTNSSGASNGFFRLFTPP
jgi:hypothetical protein